MSCVDVPVPSSSISHSRAHFLEPGHNGSHSDGRGAQLSDLNTSGRRHETGGATDATSKTGGRSRGGFSGRGGLSSAMTRGFQHAQPSPARSLTSADAAPSAVPADAKAPSGSGAPAPSPTRGAASGAAASGPQPRAGGGGGRSSGAANANHLLNFQYESARGSSGRGSGRGGARSGSARGAGGGSGGASVGGSASRRYGTGSSRPQKYDKNKFLQANFRFLVSDAVDAAGYEADADKMFDWEDVLQVEMATTCPVQCPISLDSPPLCPQITPCGHVFSFPAIMHHLVNHGGEQLRRSAPCPLCFAPVVARELRLVRVRHVAQPRAGDVLTLALIRRTRTSIIPQPVDAVAAAAATVAAREAAGGSGGAGGAAGGGSEPLSLFDRNPFAKFVVGGDARELWRTAAAQLAACALQLVAEGDVDAALEAPYVYSALDQLAVRARRWAEHRAEVLAARGLLVAREGPAAAPEALGAEAEAEVKKMFTAAVSDVTATREAAVARAALDQKYPSLAPPQPAGAQRTATPGGGGGDGRTATTPTAAPPSPSSSWASRGSGSSRQLTVIAKAAGPARNGASGGGGGDGGNLTAITAPAASAPVDSSSPTGMAIEAEPSLDQRLPFDAVFSDDEDTAAPPLQPPPRRSSGGSGSGGEPLPTEQSDTITTTAASPAAASDAAASAVLVGSGSTIGEAAAVPPPPPMGSSPPSVASELLLGSSPNSSSLNTPGSQGEFYTYQAADGSWLFMHPLNLRCLLHHHGSYDSCPPVITARLLELEDVVQCDATRRRWRFLSHLPLAGAFKLCELALDELMPSEALAPFTDELAAREKRRRRARADERRRAAAEAAAAARAAAARLGPSAEELLAMPSLSQAVGGSGGGGGGGGSALVAAAGAAVAALAREVALTPSEVAESIALQASLEEAAAAAAAGNSAGGGGSGGVSFAHITKMGYAATGPALGSSPPSGSIAAAAAGSAPTPLGAWGSRPLAAGSRTTAGGLAAASSPWGGGNGSTTATLGGTAGPWGAGKGAAAVKAATGVGGGKGATGGPASGWAAVAAAAEGEGPGTPGGSASASGGKKGKAGKGTLLFSTGNQRKY